MHMGANETLSCRWFAHRKCLAVSIVAAAVADGELQARRRRCMQERWAGSVCETAGKLTKRGGLRVGWGGWFGFGGSEVTG